MKNANDQNLLIFFAQKGNTEAVRFLILNYGDTLDINLKDRFGKTALDYAQENSNLEMVGILNSCQSTFTAPFIETTKRTTFEIPQMNKDTTFKVSIQEKSMINCDDLSYE